MLRGFGCILCAERASADGGRFPGEPRRDRIHFGGVSLAMPTLRASLDHVIGRREELARLCLDVVCTMVLSWTSCGRQSAQRGGRCTHYTSGHVYGCGTPERHVLCPPPGQCANTFRWDPQGCRASAVVRRLAVVAIRVQAGARCFLGALMRMRSERCVCNRRRLLSIRPWCHTVLCET